MMGPRLPAAERRHQLLNVALDVFSRDGYHDTSMNDLAIAAGVTKPVLYQHFPSKVALYLELLDEVGLQLDAAITEGAARATEPRSKVVSGLAAYFTFVRDHRSEFRLVFGSSAQGDQAFAGAVRDIEASIAGNIAAMLTPTVPDDVALRVAHGIVGMAESTCRYWLSNEPDLDPELLGAELASLLWGGLSDFGTTRP